LKKKKFFKKKKGKLHRIQLLFRKKNKKWGEARAGKKGVSKKGKKPKKKSGSGETWEGQNLEMGRIWGGGRKKAKPEVREFNTLRKKGEKKVRKKLQPPKV